jgi:hypothetical protein
MIDLEYIYIYFLKCSCWTIIATWDTYINKLVHGDVQFNISQYVSNSHTNTLHPFLKFYEGMKDLLLFKNDEKTLMDKTTWLRPQHMDVPMNISYETNLQHQGYESHQYSICYGTKRLKKKFSIFPHEHEP